MDIKNETEIRIIELPSGQKLEFEFSPRFAEIVRKQFNLPDDESISDEYLKMYLWGAVKGALDKAEGV